MNWLLASCSTTIVIEKTSPVTEIIAPAIVESTDRAPSGPLSNASGIVPTPWSTSGRPIPRTTASTHQVAGTTQNGPSTARHQRRTRETGRPREGTGAPEGRGREDADALVIPRSNQVGPRQPSTRSRSAIASYGARPRASLLKYT